MTNSVLPRGGEGGPRGAVFFSEGSFLPFEGTRVKKESKETAFLPFY